MATGLHLRATLASWAKMAADGRSVQEGVRVDRWQEERVLTITLHMRTMVDAQASMLGMVMLDTKIKKAPTHTTIPHT